MMAKSNAKLRSDVVRAVLAESKLSQNALARLIPVTSGYMSQLMNGTRHASSRVQARIRYIFGGCKFNDLFEIIPDRRG